jgi:SAM-dependent methyltransferase
MEKTREYYENFALNYFRKTHNACLPVLWEKVTNLQNVSKILDLGCGSGRDLRYFADRGFNPVGLDLSYNLLKLAFKFSGCPVVQGDILALPYKGKSFDIVWSIGSLLHIPRCLIDDAILETHRILKSESIFIASIKKGRGETSDSLGRHTAFYQLEEWTRILRRNHFDVLSVDTTKENRGKEVIEWIVTISRNE